MIAKDYIENKSKKYTVAVQHIYTAGANEMLLHMEGLLEWLRMNRDICVMFGTENNKEPFIYKGKQFTAKEFIEQYFETLNEIE